VPDAFLKIADDVDAIAAAARRFLAVDPQWAAESEAGEEVAQEGDFADAWSQTPVQHVILLAGTALVMAEDHLTGMAAAIRAEHTVFSPLTITRTVLSAAGSAYHLLEPGIGVRARLARGWTQQLVAYTETMAILSDHPEGDSFGHAKRRRLEIKASAERHGFRVGAPRWDARNIYRSQWHIDTKPPKEGDLIADVLASSGDVGTILFRYTSAFAHAQPHAVAFMVAGEPVAVRQGVSRTSIGYGLERMLLFTMGAALAVHAAVIRACGLFGRDGDEWSQMFRRIMLKWAQLSRRLKSSDEVPIGEVARQLGLWLPTWG
jgi:hypothetical protein